ncbi:MAG: 4Fe-4S binding protein [Candidatus Ratteibacteria bacterium]|nr:4Fe-4S binding protein [Candidatus Ratteibacteria bacterium]
MRRKLIQIISTLAANPAFISLYRKEIYQGNLKSICVPILNCHACPLAVGACPIGSLQNILISVRASFAITQYHIGLYVIGFLGVVGSFVGKMPCGWLCPFGFLQEIFYKIPSPKISIHRAMPLLKYAFLLIMVIVLPILIVDELGYGQTWFCKFICPAGTLEAGFPLIVLIEDLRSQIGLLFSWKVGLLVIFLIWMIVSKRPFCRVVCPLGATFSLFNKVSLFRMVVDKDKCIECDMCYKNCPTGVKVYEDTNNPDCIRCLNCVKTCKYGALSFRFVKSKKLEQ